uniref:Uncharacterized protein n=1 Tax=Ananas comosus var. bracteatus TaxID=296719 RepID=A0A6V7PHD9_ANACO|nr:unnamed protein product [Ananas comosus var. bracteatus]
MFMEALDLYAKAILQTHSSLKRSDEEIALLDTYASIKSNLEIQVSRCDCELDWRWDFVLFLGFELVESLTSPTVGWIIVGADLETGYDILMADFQIQRNIPADEKIISWSCGK